MLYRLFLDDIRNPSQIFPTFKDHDFIIVRSFNEFVNYIQKNGLPEFISFDNDLGLSKDGIVDKDGYDCAKWLVYDSGMDLKDLKFYVHSANPVAKLQIQSLLDNYINYLKKEK